MEYVVTVNPSNRTSTWLHVPSVTLHLRRQDMLLWTEDVYEPSFVMKLFGVTWESKIKKAAQQIIDRIKDVDSNLEKSREAIEGFTCDSKVVLRWNSNNH